MKTCGSCNLCCKVVAVESLNKPAGSWCKHAKPGNGCGIYGSHPAQCQGFKCLWLEDPSLSDEWKPNKIRFVVRADGNDSAIAIDVDPAMPDAWRKQPYFNEIKSWSQIAVGGRGRVLVYVGAKTYVVFPEEELFLGDVDVGDYLSTGYRRGEGWRQPFATVRRGLLEREVLGQVRRL